MTVENQSFKQNDNTNTTNKDHVQPANWNSVDLLRSSDTNFQRNDRASGDLPTLNVVNSEGHSKPGKEAGPGAKSAKEKNPEEETKKDLGEFKKELGKPQKALNALLFGDKLERSATIMANLGMDGPAKMASDLADAYRNSVAGRVTGNIAESEAFKPIKAFAEGKAAGHLDLQNQIREKLGKSPIGKKPEHAAESNPEHRSESTGDSSGQGRHRDESAGDGQHRPGEGKTSADEIKKRLEGEGKPEATKPGETKPTEVKPGGAARAAEAGAEDASKLGKLAKVGELAGETAGRLAGPMAIGLGALDAAQGVDKLLNARGTGDLVEGGVMTAAGVLETVGGALDTTGVLAPVGEALQGVGALAELGVAAWDNRAAIGKAASKAGHVIAEGAQKAEHAVESAAKGAEEAASKAGHAVVDGAKKLFDSIF